MPFQIAGINHLDGYDSIGARHHLDNGLLVHPGILIVAVHPLAFQIPDKLGDVLESVELCVLPQNQHIVMDKSNLVYVVDEHHLRACKCLLFVVHLEKGIGGELAHLIRISQNVNRLVKQSIPVFLVGLLRQGVVAHLVGPVIQLRIKAPVIGLYREHQYHISHKDCPAQTSVSPWSPPHG